MKAAIKKIAQMMHQSDPRACFAIEFWDGDILHFGNPPQVTLCLKTKDCAKKIIKKGFSGLGESYIAGDLEINNDLQELLRLGFAINFDKNRLSRLQKWRMFVLLLRNRDTLPRAPKNISFHYDLGNEFYALYLDRTMTYSCAYFKNPDDSLEQAQLNKYEHIARKLLLQPNDNLLDIGCGWGGMLIYAAQRYGITGTGITLSKNQHEYATRKIRELGLQDRIKILYQDYRQTNGTYDKIVSIGMLEHVGEKFLSVFFQKVSDLLKKGGLGLVHTIGKESPSESDPWIVNHIFPGGYLPILYEITREMGKIDLPVLDVENLRLHYAKTLEKWVENFKQNIEKIEKSFGNALVRRWLLFLNSCAAGFRHGDFRLFQVLFSNGMNNALPTTRAHIYQDKSLPHPF